MSSSPGLPDLPSNSGKSLRRGEDSRRQTSRPASASGRALARRTSATPPAVLTGPPTPASLWRGLQRHLPLALSLGVILGSLAAVVAWSLYNPSRYRATALVKILASPQTILRTNRFLFEDSARLSDYLTTQATLIRTDLVLNKALGYNGISDLPTIQAQDDPISWLADNLKVSFSGEIMKISISGDRGQDVMALANAVTDAYLKEAAGNENEMRRQRAKTMAQMIVDLGERIKERRETYRSLAAMAGSSSSSTLEFKHKLLMAALETQRNRVDQFDNELSELNIQISLLTGEPIPTTQTVSSSASSSDAAPASNSIPDLAGAPIPKPSINPQALAQAIASDPRVIAAQEQYRQLQSARRRLRSATRGGSSDAAVRHLEAQCKAALQSLNNAQEAARMTVLAGARKGRSYASTNSSEADIAFLKLRLQILERFRNEAVNEYENRKAAVENLNNDSIDLQESQREIERMEATLAQLNDQHERLKMELLNNDQERITLFEKALRAQPLSIRKKYLVTAGAGGGVFGLILIGFAWFDARTRRVAQVGDVVNGLGMDIVGTLPALPSARDRRTNAASWENLLMESVDATRTMLLHASRTEQIQVVMITSALKGEGKTSLASHLATSLARARRRTLLIDGDLRSPMLHKLFDLPRAPGLSELLREEVEVADVLQVTPAPNLILITAGMADPDSLAALGEGRVQYLIDAVRNQYDFILIDTPPVLPVADTLQLSQHVDAAIFSVLRDVSRLPKIHEAYERLASLGVHMLGTVVAGTQTDRDPSYNYPYAGSAS